jgi:hypothetical protein
VEKQMTSLVFSAIYYLPYHQAPEGSLLVGAHPILLRMLMFQYQLMQRLLYSNCSIITNSLLLVALEAELVDEAHGD